MERRRTLFSGRNSSSCDQLRSPKSLQFLVSNLKYPRGNYLIHLFVLDNCWPKDSRHESYVRPALLSFPAACVNARNGVGLTALHMAVLARSSFMVKMLLSCHPTINVDTRGLIPSFNTALHFAAYEDLYKVHVHRIFSGHQCKHLKTALVKAGKEESVEIVKALLERGASLDVLNRHQEAPIHVAAKYNKFEMLKLFIGKGADLNVTWKDEVGKTPLYLAVKNKCLEAVEVLLESGAEMEEYDGEGCTPLHIIASFNQIEMLKLFISKGADLNAQDHKGWTPLQAAARWGHSASVEVLVANGASLEVQSIDGTTPLHTVARYRKIEMLKLLISKGAALNAQDVFGRTPLHHATREGCLEAVKVLVESGADVDAVDESGKTPLETAGGKNRAKVVEYFRSRFSDVNAVDGDARFSSS